MEAGVTHYPARQPRAKGAANCLLRMPAACLSALKQRQRRDPPSVLKLSEGEKPPWKGEVTFCFSLHLAMYYKVKPDQLRVWEDCPGYKELPFPPFPTSPDTTSSYSQCCYSVAQACPTLCDPVDYSMPGFPVHHQPPESAQIHVHRVSDAIQLSHPLSSPSPPALNLS